MNELQRTLSWHRARLGKITGSCVGKIIAAGKAKDAIFSATGITYLTSVAAEMLLSPAIVEDDDNFTTYLDEVNAQTKAMRIGTEREAEARELYCELTGVQISDIGSTPHPDMPTFASSPDGITVDGSGALEIKCPTPATYTTYLANVHTPDDLKRVNADYYWQCIAHMAVTGSQWTDFVAYCPYALRPMHMVRIPRDEEAIATLLDRVKLAVEYIDTILFRAKAAA